MRENHKFLWEDEEGDEIDTKKLKWEQRIAKKYWDKLFKEYAITDLTQFKSKKVLNQLNIRYFYVTFWLIIF